MIGLRGIHVDSPDRIAAAWDEALASPVPVVLEVRTDPNVPPLPPHFTLKQAHAFVASLPSDPDRGRVLAHTARQVLGSVLPGDRDRERSDRPMPRIAPFTFTPTHHHSSDANAVTPPRKVRPTPA